MQGSQLVIRSLCITALIYIVFFVHFILRIFLVCPLLSQYNMPIEFQVYSGFFLFYFLYTAGHNLSPSDTVINFKRNIIGLPLIQACSSYLYLHIYIHMARNFYTFSALFGMILYTTIITMHIGFSTAALIDSFQTTRFFFDIESISTTSNINPIKKFIQFLCRSHSSKKAYCSSTENCILQRTHKIYK